MKALDTNILVRFVTRDDIAQADKVLNLFKKAENRGGEEFWIPLVVVLEMLWVLEAVYRIPRKKILEILRDLIDLPILK
ncbi:MAG TPA: type II toxin-antitoxin system VapC family toxin, partial [Thermosulfurimonas dismutans]|nr:type II toxin-antitoxin system VapC family toxin [Thermosulfurimonas dismutans]